jgi:hypothetical protein
MMMIMNHEFIPCDVADSYLKTVEETEISTRVPSDLHKDACVLSLFGNP